MSFALLVMAAGMSTRYGGLKQLEALGPNGETMLDYAVTHAQRAGCTKVVFVIRREIEADFRAQIGNKHERNLEVAYAYQGPSFTVRTQK